MSKTTSNLNIAGKKQPNIIGTIEVHNPVNHESRVRKIRCNFSKVQLHMVKRVRITNYRELSIVENKLKIKSGV